MQNRAKQSTAYTAAANAVAKQQIYVDDPAMFSLDSNILFPQFEVNNETKVAALSPLGQALNPLVCHVINIDPSTDALMVVPLNVTTLPNLPADTILRRMGTAKDELAAMSGKHGEIDPLKTI